ncbi:MAG: aminoacyl-tRNA hydrolase [Elusimicrobia bacterium]|nr:aminoacyl-tRNA hydrolase [Elusimicrobiota bacterium]
MKLIIGLGNPGRKYSRTRHNIGFAIVDNFADRKSLKWKNYKDKADIVPSDNFLLIKPALFMNNSGSAVKPLIKKYLPDSASWRTGQAGNPDPEDIIVIHDDMDIEFGCIRLKRNGSSGGHNGVQSIIETLGTDNFSRLRIGIGRPPEFMDPVDFVLSDFNNREKKELKTIITKTEDVISFFLESGLQKAMNIFNKRE